jgi:hypothetical protein
MWKIFISIMLWTIGLLSLERGISELIPEWHGTTAIIAGLFIIAGGIYWGFLKK